MKESGKDRLKCAACESTLSTAGAVPLPQWGRLRYESIAFLDTMPFPMRKAKRRRLRRPKRKPTPPRCARQPLPREGARVDNSLLPMEGGAPKGRRLDGESGMKKSGEIVSSTSFAKAPYPPLFLTQSLPLGKADDTRSASAHKALRHRPLYIRGEAATFIPLPYSSRAFLGHPGTARPMSDPSNPFSDIKEKNLCV